MTTHSIRTENLPSSSIFFRDTLLVCDKRLLSSSSVRAWSKRFHAVYPVTSGEKLKAVEAFPRHITNIQKLTDGISRNRLTIVALGGGSVCDFSGFVASVLKRGVNLTLIPSTWLAALDAAHGGKTALNIASAKNQIGTFYPASKIYLVKSLLRAQPRQRAEEAMSELVKIAALDGGAWTRKVFGLHQDPPELLWTLLDDAIRAKRKIVDVDPFERNGKRQALNFGHTMGHVFEAACGLPHGKAIAAGLQFSLEWSRRSMGLPSRDEKLLLSALRVNGKRWPKLSEQKFLQFLSQDKKRSSSKALSFVFLKKIGKPVRKRVFFRSILHEAKRQGWVT